MTALASIGDTFGVWLPAGLERAWGAAGGGSESLGLLPADAAVLTTVAKQISVWGREHGLLDAPERMPFPVLPFAQEGEHGDYFALVLRSASREDTEDAPVIKCGLGMREIHSRWPCWDDWARGLAPPPPRARPRPTQSRPTESMPRVEGDIRQTWEAILAWLQTYEPDAVAKLRGPAAPSDLAALAARFAKVPKDLRSLLSCNDGETDLGQVLGGMPLYSTEMVLAEHTQMNQIAEECRRDGMEFQWSTDWIPISGDGGGDLCVLDSETGVVLWRDHELDGTVRVSDSLHQLLARFLEQLVDGRWSWSEEENCLMRNDEQWIGPTAIEWPGA